MMEHAIGIIQQVVAVSLCVLVLYLLQEWILKSQQCDRNMRIMLQEVKSYRVQAREHSLEFLASMDQSEASEASPILVDNNLLEQNNFPVCQLLSHEFKGIQCE
jgi:hypothetical protein